MGKRTLILVTGLNFCGKSHIVKDLQESAWFSDVAVFSFDTVRLELFPGRPDWHVTKSEHLFKNEWLRNEILRALVLGKRTVIADVMLPTHAHHREPMVAMVKRARSYVQAIESEYAIRDNLPETEVIAGVDLKVILCYASLEAVEHRIAGDHQFRRSFGSGVFDWKSIRGAHQLFEYPDGSLYEPFYVDTSDDSEGAEACRMEEIRRYLIENFNPPDLAAERRNAAVRYQKAILARIEKEMAEAQ